MCLGQPANPDTGAEAKPCCKYFSEFYGGQGDGASCMSKPSILRYQEVKKRPCPYVRLEPGNFIASDLLWIGMAPRFNVFFEGLRQLFEKAYHPLKVLRAYRRAIWAMQQPTSMDAMGLSKKSQPRTPPTRHRQPVRRPQKRPMRRR